jgi:hypothetical protein
MYPWFNRSPLHGTKRKAVIGRSTHLAQQPRHAVRLSVHMRIAALPQAGSEAFCIEFVLLTIEHLIKGHI